MRDESKLEYESGRPGGGPSRDYVRCNGCGKLRPTRGVCSNCDGPRLRARRAALIGWGLFLGVPLVIAIVVYVCSLGSGEAVERFFTTWAMATIASLLLLVIIMVGELIMTGRVQFLIFWRP